MRKAAIDIGDLAGDAVGQIREQESRGIADIFDGDVAAQRRVGLHEVEDLAEVLDAGRRQRLDRTGRNAVHAHALGAERDRKSTRLNSSHANISYAVFCLKKKKIL